MGVMRIETFSPGSLRGREGECDCRAEIARSNQSTANQDSDTEKVGVWAYFVAKRTLVFAS